MTYTIDIRAFTDAISDRILAQLCRENPELRFETDERGKLDERVYELWRKTRMVN